MRALLKTLALPPASLLLLALVGLLLRRKAPRLGRGLMVAAAVLGYALCTPLVAGLLTRSLEVHPALDPTRLGPDRGPGGAQLIVCLSADIDPLAPEYRAGDAGETLGSLTWQRMRYAAFVQRSTGLPLAVTGGRLRHGTEPVAELMRRAFEQELAVPVRWVEARAATTWQNASFLAALLRAGRASSELPTVLVVTHAWHMPRALQAFAAAGFRAVAAPTAFRAAPRLELGEILPSAHALAESAFAVHEWLGRGWYAVAGGL